MRYVLGFMCVLALGLVGCSGGDGVACVDNVCPCTEAGIRAAIEVGGEDPYTFDCDGARTIVTEAEIVIDNDVILDGEGQLTVDGNETHRVFSVPEGTTAELRGFTITRGALFPNPEANVGGIENLGTLTMVNSTVSGNVGAGIVNGGTLTATSITVRDNPGGGIDNEGALTLNSSSVEVVSSISGPLTIANSTLGKVFATAGLTLTYSTVVGEGLRLQGGAEVLLTSNIVEGGCGCGAFGPADCADYITSNGYNIESPGDTCGFDQSTDRPETTPAELNLGPLTDNGGPTLTHKPGDGDFGEGSVAIDHIPEADCTVDTDQRGEPRPVVIVGPESCDVGSVECSETSGTGGSGGAAGIGGGGVGGHGSGVGDPNCGMYCDKLVECYPMYRDACMEGCADEAANEAAVSEECASAAAAQRACVGDLSCEEVSEWGYRVPPESFPCLMETTAADSLCETTCQNDDECDDGRECSWDRCIEGSCQHGLANCPCEAPLSDHCTGSECWTWDEAVAGLRESCEPYRRADAGQCGELRYIETYWGYDSGIRYFDASGVLVAVAGCTDCPCIECGPGHEATCIHYGPVPECEPQLEEILCEEPW